MDDTTHLLVQVLAATDVLWEPCRRSVIRDQAAAAMAERRDAFDRAGGLPILAGGTGAARQANSTTIAAMRRLGLLSSSGRTKALAVRLTDRGDDTARTMCGCYRVDESWPLLMLIADLTTADPIVFEGDVLSGRNIDSDAAGLLGIAAPLLARGLLAANSDQEGRIGYLVTPHGRAALKAGPPRKASDLPNYDPECGDLYDELVDAGLAARESWVPERPNVVSIPLGCGDWPEVPRATARLRTLRRKLRAVFPKDEASEQ